ncbi:phosphotransferase family protein [Nocardioides sp. AX2bis]|uniref:phosphotransferase family protein n=1 Tax=Nocardioides sp. AX2bis TaxID=2653157 RepID=UPI001F2A0145|nr:phosphotransferase [Nocardioides sp. AX2bis]
MQPTLEPLSGGWSGETFLAGVGAERTVVRVYGGRSLARGPAAPEVDAAVLALVRGLLPVPDVLEVRRADPVSGSPGLLVTSFVPGVRGDLALDGIREDDEALARLGRGLGRVAGLLACMPQPSTGPFLDGDLRIGSYGDQVDVGGVLAARRDDLHLADGWGPSELDGLEELAGCADEVLSDVRRRSLVHSDLNPKNVLVDPTSLEIAAVLDWEFAHAGHPATDLGNLLRHDRRPAYVEGVVAAYRERVPAAEGRRDLLDRARAADLVALLDLAARPGADMPLDPEAGRARALLLAVARARDWHAQPD